MFIISNHHTNRVDTKLNASREEKKLNIGNQPYQLEQCGRSVLPKISHPIKIADQGETHTLKLVLTPSGKTLKNLNSELDHQPKEIDLLIGPEGVHQGK